MNPATRTLLQVHPDNAAEADHMFTTLMGEKVGPRKDFIRAEATQGAEPRCLRQPRPPSRPRLRGSAATRPRVARASAWPTSSTSRRRSSTALARRPRGAGGRRLRERLAATCQPGHRRRLCGARLDAPGRHAARGRGPAPGVERQRAALAGTAPGRRRTTASCGSSRCPACAARCATIRSDPGSCCGAWRAGQGTGSRSTASPRCGRAASSPSPSAGRSSSSSSTRRRRSSAASSAPRWRPCPTACQGAPGGAAWRLEPALRWTSSAQLMGDAEDDGPEGALLGPPRLEPRRPAAPWPPCSRQRPPRRCATRTAPGPGSSATPSPHQPPELAAELRARLAGLRRDRRRPLHHRCRQPLRPVRGAHRSP